MPFILPSFKSMSNGTQNVFHVSAKSVRERITGVDLLLFASSNLLLFTVSLRVQRQESFL